MSAQIVLVIRMFVAIVIYVFLALSLFTLWRTTFPPQKQKEGFEIQINIMGTDKIKKFSVPEIYIGRDDRATFQLTDQSVSNMHARIYMKERRWWIEDLASTNGTFINEVKIVEPSRIYHEDQIKCGNVTFQSILPE